MKSQRVKVNKDSKFLSVFIKICLVGLVGLFVYLAMQMYNLTVRQNADRKSIDKQIETIGDLPDMARDLAKGNLKIANKISTTVARFSKGLDDALLKEKQNAKEDGVALDKKTEGNYAELDSNLSILKLYTSPLVENSKIIETTLNLDKQITISSDKAIANIDALTADINKFSGTEAMSVAITNIDKTTDQVKDNVHSFVLGALSYKDLKHTLDEGLDFYNENIDKLQKEVKSIGPSAFFSGKGEEAAKQLVANIKDVISQANTLKVNGSNYEELTSNVAGIRSQVGDMTSQLYQLKNISYDKKPTPFNLPFTYVEVLAAIGFLIVFLAWLDFWLTSRSMKKLVVETNRLKDIANERSKNDQEAILRLMDELSDLSDGDLTVEAQVTEDFTGAIADSVNFAIESMRGMVQTITKTSDEIQKVTNNVGDISQNLETSSKEQSKQVNFSYETALRMSESLNNVAQNTDSSVDIARSSVDIAQEGREKVRMTVESMNDIRGNIQETSKHIKKLGESSQEIGDIIEIIKGIADQTNILSLNAAIQATTAGEAGRGFAVVADEIQRLAERSANASKRIEILVKTIQADANEATGSMEKSTRHVVTGAGIAEEAGSSLDKIEKVSKNLADLIVNVSKATRTSADMAKGVSMTMNNLTSINEQATNNVKESVGFVDNLKSLSLELKDSVSGFKLPNN